MRLAVPARGQILGHADRCPVCGAPLRDFTAAGVLTAGVYLSLLLAGGTAAVRPAAMTLFDAARPGALCAGQP
jgi:hypothetical protein